VRIGGDQMNISFEINILVPTILALFTLSRLNLNSPRTILPAYLPQFEFRNIQTLKNVTLLYLLFRDLGGFRLKRLLSEDAERKRAVIEADVEGSSQPAVIVIEKLPFT
jgi:hypothetical protein